MEIIDGLKVFHTYPLFFKWVNNFDGELVVAIGGDVYLRRHCIAKFNFIRK